MKKWKIGIFTEAGSSIGLGHFTRCNALYDACELKSLEPFFIIKGDKTLKTLLSSKHAEIFPWTDEKKISDLSRMISGRFDVAIIDSYLASEEIYNTISSHVRFTVCVDDDKRLSYPKGFVVNSSPDAQRLDYKDQEGVEYLLGNSFALLRKPFWNIPDKVIRAQFQHVLLSLGGDDYRNLTPDILKFFIEHYPDVRKSVVIGNSFKNVQHIQDIHDSNTQLVYYPNAEQMLECMLDADIAVVGAGQTVNELARVGVATVPIIVVDNQRNYIAGWEPSRFLPDVLEWDDPQLLQKIGAGVEGFSSYESRVEKMSIGRKYVDAQGALRVVDRCIAKLS